MEPAAMEPTAMEPAASPAAAGVGRCAPDHQHGRERRRNRDLTEHHTLPNSIFVLLFTYLVASSLGEEIAPGQVNLH
jgi:hypothetical protein